jgi:NADH:ubiquinone oxidoreductase subunit 3 (subunit A)
MKLILTALGLLIVVAAFVLATTVSNNHYISGKGFYFESAVDQVDSEQDISGTMLSPTTWFLLIVLLALISAFFTLKIFERKNTNKSPNSKN